MSARASHAANCLELWHDRNLILAQNGYCFKTRLGQPTLANYDCWTDNLRLTRNERARVVAIRHEERRKGCKVN
ncbi:MAG: YARHG domain-containing protein [Rhizobiaceae bacterium]